ncbi:MAG: AIR synthase-related protein, partial [Enterococcus viikkiensis]
SQELGEELLMPTRIYVDTVLPLIKKKLVNGIAHVTGGGFVENLPRMLPDNLACEIELGTWPILPIFDALAKYGELPEKEMYEIFNMGIGMVLAVAPEKLEELQADLTARDEEAFVIGKVIEKKAEPIIFKGAKA